MRLVCSTPDLPQSSEHGLQNSDHAFRERIDEASDQREVTLRFRHPDRYLAVSRDMSGRHVRTTFEEDIKAPFHGLYSHSGSQGIAGSKDLNKLNDLHRLFPGLPKQLDHCDDSQAITAVEDRTWRELVLTGADFRICKSPKVETECALIVWYDARSNPHRPEVVEFSFRYGDDQEAYGDKSARRAYEIFQVLQGPALAAWVDPTGMTKTAIAYHVS